MKGIGFTKGAIVTACILAAGIFYLLQVPEGGVVRATEVGEAVPEATPTTSIIAEHPVVEVVEDRDDHTRVWRVVRDMEVTDPGTGEKRLEQTESFIKEKGSGLCYRDALGNWQPSVIEWETIASGFQIARAGYLATKGLFSEEPLEYSVNGKGLRFGPSSLVLYDGQRQQTLAEVVPALTGEILESDPSKLRFNNALGDRVHVEFDAERDGIHQNIIFDAKPPLPPEMSPDVSYLYVVTELNLDEAVSAYAIEATMAGEVLPLDSPFLFTQPTSHVDVVFSEPGARELFRLVDSKVADAGGSEILAEKQLVCVPETGKTYLFERIPYSFLTNTNRYPVTWDYRAKSGTMSSSETWCPRYTYYLSSPLSVASGVTLTINPGTVVKLKGTSTYMGVNGTLIAKGEPYNYIVFTSAHDDDCGEDLDGTGKPLGEASPQKGDYYAAFWLSSNQATLRDSEVRYCKFAYGAYAGGTNPSGYTAGHDIRDSIFRNCTYGLAVYTATNATNPAAVRNNLFVNVGTDITLFSANNWGVYSNTFDGPSDMGLCFLSQCSSFNVKYNIFTQTTDPIAGTPGVGCTIQYNAFYSSPQEGLSPIVLTKSPYDTSSPGLGLHYLNNATNGGQKCRTGPWTATPSEVGLYDKVYTVKIPTAVSGVKITQDTWAIMADNATAENPVALGYHHNRVDYTLTGDATFSGAGALTVQPGVVVCIGDLSTSRSLNANNGGKIVSEGEPEGNGYSIITTCPTSSMYVRAKTFDNQLQGILKIYAGASPNCRVSHTRFLWNSSLYVYRKLLRPIESNRFQCTYYGVCNNAENSIRNNLFYVCNYGVWDSGQFVGTTISSNNTFDHCPTGFRCITSGSGRATVVRDSLFTKCAYGLNASQSSGATFTESYNAFWLNTINFYKDGAARTPDTSDIQLGTSEWPYDRPAGNYDDGPKRNTATWYLDQSSTWTIVDDGSCTSIEAGLDILTTASDGRPDIGPIWQGHSGNRLDIGYHYPIDPAHCILHPGLRQTDIALRWNNMTNGCLRAFSLDGSARDDMGIADGKASDVSYSYMRYRDQGYDSLTRNLKYD